MWHESICVHVSDMMYIMLFAALYCGRHEKWQRFTAIRDRRIVENRRHRFILCLLVTSS